MGIGKGFFSLFKKNKKTNSEAESAIRPKEEEQPEKGQSLSAEPSDRKLAADTDQVVDREISSDLKNDPESVTQAESQHGIGETTIQTEPEWATKVSEEQAVSEPTPKAQDDLSDKSMQISGTVNPDHRPGQSLSTAEFKPDTGKKDSQSTEPAGEHKEQESVLSSDEPVVSSEIKPASGQDKSIEPPQAIPTEDHAAADLVAVSDGVSAPAPAPEQTDPDQQDSEPQEAPAAKPASTDETVSVKTTPQKEKQSFFERLKKTRQNISFGLEALIKGKQISEELYEDLETALLTADLGVETTNAVIEKLRVESKLRELHDAGALRENLKNILKDILKPCEIPLQIEKRSERPYVILMVGVNGAGKTTTIGKLVEKFKAQHLKVMLAAGDTFRAAAVEQLKAWGARANVPVVAQEAGSDSASVIFDAIKSATARSYDVLICDTAGRLQNKDYLMEELKKIVRVMKKTDDAVPDEVLLVLDATTGQNAVSQTKLFSEAVNVTGLCITKLDGTAKGGVVFALADRFKIPLRYVGIGEKAEDLKTFKVDSFVDALIDE